MHCTHHTHTNTHIVCFSAIIPRSIYISIAVVCVYVCVWVMSAQSEQKEEHGTRAQERTKWVHRQLNNTHSICILNFVCKTRNFLSATKCNSTLCQKITWSMSDSIYTPNIYIIYSGLEVCMTVSSMKTFATNCWATAATE